MSVQHFSVPVKFTCLILLETTFFHFKRIRFYLLQRLCGSPQTVQFAGLGSFLSCLSELGFIYFICRLFCLLPLSGEAPSHFPAMQISFFCATFLPPHKIPRFTAQPRQAFCQETVSAEAAVRDARSRPDLCRNMTEVNCDSSCRCSLRCLVSIILKRYIQQDLFLVEMFLLLRPSTVQGICWLHFLH